MHRPFDVAQRRAFRIHARYRKVGGAAGKIEKNLTQSRLIAVPKSPHATSISAMLGGAIEYSHSSVFIMFRHLVLHDFFHAYRIEELLLNKEWSLE